MPSLSRLYSLPWQRVTLRSEYTAGLRGLTLIAMDFSHGLSLSIGGKGIRFSYTIVDTYTSPLSWGGRLSLASGEYGR